MAANAVSWDTPTPPSTPTRTFAHRLVKHGALMNAIGASPPPSPTGTGALVAAHRLQRTDAMARITAQLLLGNNITVPPAFPGGLGPAVAPTAVIGGAQPAMPRCGGITNVNGVDIAWCGGGVNGGPTERTAAASMLAYRPTEFKAKTKTETSCSAGLAESFHLTTADKLAGEKGETSLVTMQAWINQIKQIIEDRGMDSVFRMVNGAAEQYLLAEFGRADKGKVADWLTFIRANGDDYDIENLQMSGKMLKASLELDMLKKVERETPANASGPEVYAAVVNLHQSLGSSAVRQLTEQLQQLKLSKEPAENVTIFGDKVLDLALRIQGAGPLTCPHDLGTLVYECFKGCTTSEFASEVTDFCKKSNKNDPTVADWEASVSELKSLYRTLVVRKEWDAEKHHKEKADVQAMQAMISTLQQTVKNLGSSKQSGSGDGGTDTRTCYHCGKKGHVKPNCPDKDKPKVGSAGGSGGATPSSGTNAAGINRVAPKEGEPHTKMDSDGAETKWCGTCNRWWKGEKSHLTEEHVKGKGKGTPPSAAAATTTTVTGAYASADNDSGGTLRLVGGYMASIGKPLGHGELTFCPLCRRHVLKSEDHHHGISHAQEEIAQGLWTVVTRKSRSSGIAEDKPSTGTAPKPAGTGEQEEVNGNKRTISWDLEDVVSGKDRAGQY